MLNTLSLLVVVAVAMVAMAVVGAVAQADIAHLLLESPLAEVHLPSLS
jgi:hypothetical protein